MKIYNENDYFINFIKLPSANAGPDSPRRWRNHFGRQPIFLSLARKLQLSDRLKFQPKKISNSFFVQIFSVQSKFQHEKISNSFFLQISSDPSKFRPAVRLYCCVQLNYIYQKFSTLN